MSNEGKLSPLETSGTLSSTRHSPWEKAGPVFPPLGVLSREVRRLFLNAKSPNKMENFLFLFIF